MAQCWPSGDRKGLGCVGSLALLPCPCSLPETQFPTPGPSKPQPSLLHLARMVMWGYLDSFLHMSVLSDAHVKNADRA